VCSFFRGALLFFFYLDYLELRGREGLSVCASSIEGLILAAKRMVGGGREKGGERMKRKEAMKTGWLRRRKLRLGNKAMGGRRKFNYRGGKKKN